MKATAQIGDVKLAYTREGSGARLMCLHGGMGIDSGSLRVPGITSLAQRGCEVVLFDQRGHGDSSDANASGYTHEVWATDAHQLSQHLGWKNFALLGHSYGGFIALEYAIRWPETLSSLVLVSTSAGPVPAATVPCSTEQELRNSFAQLWPAFFDGKDKHWEIFNQLRFSPVAYRAAFGRELAQYDLREKARAISVHTLLIVGNEDHYKPHMEWMAEVMPAATLHILPNVGHFPFVEAQKKFVEIVSKFVSQHAGPGGPAKVS